MNSRHSHDSLYWEMFNKAFNTSRMAEILDLLRKSCQSEDETSDDSDIEAATLLAVQNLHEDMDAARKKALSALNSKSLKKHKIYAPGRK